MAFNPLSLLIDIPPYLVVTKISNWSPCFNFPIHISHMLSRQLARCTPAETKLTQTCPTRLTINHPLRVVNAGPLAL